MMVTPPINLLMIEANPEDALRLQNHLRVSNRALFKVAHVTHLAAGLARLSEPADPLAQTDVILLKLDLTTSPGLAAFEQIHQRHPEIPLVVVTETADYATASEAIRSRAEEILPKSVINEHTLPHVLLCAIERKKLAAQLQRLYTQQMANNQLSFALGEIQDLQTLYRTVHTHISGLMEIHLFSISTFDPERAQIRTDYVRHSGKGTNVGDPPFMLLDPKEMDTQIQVASEGRSRIILARLDGPNNSLNNGLNSSQNHAAVAEPTSSAQSTLLVPMKESGRTVGVIQVQSRNPNAYTEDDLALLEGLANVAALAIVNTQRYQAAQQELAERRQSEKQLRFQANLLNAVGQAVVATDLAGNITYWNRFAERVYGWKADEVIGKHIQQVVPVRHTKEESDAIMHTLTTGRFWDGEQNLKRKDNTYFPAAVTYSPVMSDANQLVGYVGVSVDITTRREAEVERERLLGQIHAKARELEQVLQTVPTGVLLLDAEGRLLKSNSVAKRILQGMDGLVENQIVAHLANRPLVQLLTSPKTHGLWHELKWGNQILEVIARPVENGAVTERWVLGVHDVTKEREVQQQLQQQERLAAVGQLTAGIAHDFNNVMGTIILFAQMAARSDGLSPRMQERMKTIEQQAWHASKMIQQLLDFSRQSVLEQAPLDLLPLLKEQVKMLEYMLPENIEINFSYMPGSYSVMADPTRIQQITTNLAINARDAMPEGGTLAIHLDRVAGSTHNLPFIDNNDTKSWVHLVVSDTGTGIRPEHLTHVFEPFFSTKGPEKGNGLGLAQVHGIVGQHNGHISVESRLGSGTTFQIHLPALNNTPDDQPTQDAGSLPRGNGELVLLVEDQHPLRDALAATLESWNYQVIQAENGQNALEQMQKHGQQVDLILSDMVMPVMGGKALMHALQEVGWSKPVILISGHPMDLNLNELYSKGMRTWLSKPPSQVDLAHAIFQALHTER